MRPVVLLTDFGTRDGWVGEVKGRLVSLAPEASIHDAAHDLAPGDVAAGAFVLAGLVRYWPSGTVFLCVVDPGVGSSRRPIAARIALSDGVRYFVGPDNGLLSDVLSHPVARRPMGEVVAWDISGTRAEDALGTTFDGRDLFAVCAVRIAAGEEPARFGPEVRDLVRLPALEGDVVWFVDRFGNVITNRTAEGVRGFRAVNVGTGEIPVGEIRASFADAERGATVLTVGSRGTVEIALSNDSFAARHGIPLGGAARGRPVRFLGPL